MFFFHQKFFAEKETNFDNIKTSIKIQVRIREKKNGIRIRKPTLKVKIVLSLLSRDILSESSAISGLQKTFDTDSGPTKWLRILVER